MIKKSLLFAFIIANLFLIKEGNTQWTQKSPATPPAGRFLHSIVYDSQSDRVVLFGGAIGSNNALNDTWEYDLNTDTWTQKSPATSPFARYDHTMAYDSESDRIVLFGGWVPMTLVDDTWEYDLNTDTWTQKSPTTSPSPRGYHAMAYDSESDRIVLFGGWASSAHFNDTWEYDLNTDAWTQKSPTTSPSPRRASYMAYDSESDRIVLFGGHDGATSLNDTWEYDLNTDTWTQKSPTTSPDVRVAHGIAYDSSCDRVVLFAGYKAGFLFDDTWEYDLNTDTWEETTPTNSPPGRRDFCMTYDIENKREVVFGGWWVSSGFDDTWEYECSGSSGIEVVSDKGRQEAVMFSINPTVSGKRFSISLAIHEKQNITELPVSIKIYDLSGRVVRVLFEGKLGPGSYTICWDGKDKSGELARTGNYFCVLDTVKKEVKKIILLH